MENLGSGLEEGLWEESEEGLKKVLVKGIGEEGLGEWLRRSKGRGLWSTYLVKEIWDQLEA